MWRGRGLRRAVLADRRAESPFAEDAVVTVLVDPADGPSSAPLWGWTLLTGPPSWKGLREVWLVDSAGPGRMAALFIPGTVDRKPLILYPSSAVRVVTDPALEVMSGPARKVENP